MTTQNIDLWVTVNKPLTWIRHGETIPSDACILNYVATEELNSDYNLSIVERSHEVLANSPNYYKTEDYFTDRTYRSQFKNPLFTDEFTNAVAGQQSFPLFYCHELPNNTLVNSIQIFDQYSQLVEPALYKIETVYQYTAGAVLTDNIDYIAVYNDLANSWNEETGEYVVYYVQYTLDDNSETKTVLLNNSFIYHEASFIDINPRTRKLKTWIKAYTIADSAGYYNFTFPTSTNYAVRFTENSQIKVFKPFQDEREDPWYVRVSNGNFRTYNGTSYFDYSITEYDSQDFNPIYPYRKITEDICDRLTKNLIKLRAIPLYVADRGIDLIIKDKTDNILVALTTSTTKEGTVYTAGITWDSTKIISYDQLTGFVHVNYNIKDTDIVYATYHYEEKYQLYNWINLNPVSNVNALTDKYVLYIVPRAVANANLTQTVSLHYLRLGYDNIILACSQDDTYGAPNIVSGIDTIADGTHTYDDFLSTYCINNGTVQAQHNYLVLAELSAKENINIAETTVLDARSAGGGIKEDMIDDARASNPESLWYTENSISYPAKSTIIVRLPHCLLDTYGGQFTEDDIYRIVKRHMAFGSYPIIRYYGITPQISLETVASNSITISWPSEASGASDLFTYTIYYKRLKTDTSYTTETYVEGAYDLGGTISYTIDGLISGNLYQIYVTATRVANSCALPLTLAGICGGSDQYYKECDDDDTAWGSHEGPRTTEITVKTL